MGGGGDGEGRGEVEEGKVGEAVRGGKGRAIGEG